MINRTRDTITIIYDILKYLSIQSISKPTRLMYKANLSYTQLKLYTKYLIKTGYVKTENENFAITNNGYDFVKDYQNFKNLHMLLWGSLKE
jgi:predicted transcriptional regulator